MLDAVEHFVECLYPIHPAFGCWCDKARQAIMEVPSQPQETSVYECKLGAPTLHPQYPHSDRECVCNASCEPHIHSANLHLCLHDGENDHSHCTEVPK